MDNILVLKGFLKSIGVTLEQEDTLKLEVSDKELRYFIQAVENEANICKEHEESDVVSHAKTFTKQFALELLEALKEGNGVEYLENLLGSEYVEEVFNKDVRDNQDIVINF